MRVEADGVLFDNDGVLVDSEAHVDEAWERLAIEFGLDVEELAAERSGVRAIDTLGRYLGGTQLHDAVRRLEDLEVALAAGVRRLPGSRELCESLPSERWTIVTSASRRLAHARWAGAGIRVPESTVTAEDVENGKPDPEPYLTAAARLGVNPNRCVVFEDSPSGGVAAHTAGAAVIAVGAVPWDFEPLARIDNLQAVTATSISGGLLLTIDQTHP